jgi:RNA polymerase sigma-70 factor (ECF subfamily)
MKEHDEEFVASLTTHQSRLFGFILSLVGNPHVAADVLQETNLVLWRKKHEFTHGTSFASWAFHVAYVQVMACWQQQSRSRLTLREDLAKVLAKDAQDAMADLPEQLAAMESCIDRLQPRHRKIVELKYQMGQSHVVIAQQFDTTANAVTQLLHRLRLKLMDCIQKRMKGAGDGA